MHYSSEKNGSSIIAIGQTIASYRLNDDNWDYGNKANYLKVMIIV